MTSRPSAEQRAAFYVALQQTGSARKAAIAAGVSRETGRAWAKQAKVAKAELQARAVVIATKTDIAAELTRIGLHDDQVAPRDKVNALATASKILGYDAPTRTEQVIVNASVEQWVEAQRLAAAQARALPAADVRLDPATVESSSHLSLKSHESLRPGDPPIDAKTESLSPPPNISKNSESESK